MLTALVLFSSAWLCVQSQSLRLQPRELPYSGAPVRIEWLGVPQPTATDRLTLTLADNDYSVGYVPANNATTVRSQYSTLRVSPLNSARVASPIARVIRCSGRRARAP